MRSETVVKINVSGRSVAVSSATVVTAVEGRHRRPSSHWVEQMWWCYRTSFAVPGVPSAGERWLLSFHGLDVPADIRISGNDAGSREPAPTVDAADVTQHAGTPVDLLVRFPPALATTADIYTHVLAEVQCDAADRMDAFVADLRAKKT